MRIQIDRTSVLTTIFALFALATAAPAAAQEKAPDATVPLSQEDGSPVHGTALIWDADATGDMDAHRVQVRLEDRRQGATYRVHLHREACSGDGAPLLGADGSPAADEAGRTAARTASAEASAGKTKSGETAKTAGGAEREHPALFAQTDLPGGTPAACGDVPEEKMTEQTGRDTS